jgi:hypothetical protein
MLNDMTTGSTPPHGPMFAPRIQAILRDSGGADQHIAAVVNRAPQRSKRRSLTTLRGQFMTRVSGTGSATSSASCRSPLPGKRCARFRHVVRSLRGPRSRHTTRASARPESERTKRTRRRRMFCDAAGPGSPARAVCILAPSAASFIWSPKMSPSSPVGSPTGGSLARHARRRPTIRRDNHLSRGADIMSMHARPL